LDISDPTNPLLTGSMELGGIGYDIAVADNYAYVASSNDNRELDVINISDTNNPTRAGTYNASGTANGLGVYAVGTTVYLTTQSSGAEFYILNVSNLSNISLISSLDLGADGNDVFVDGSYAFIGTSNTSREFQVIDVSNPASPALYGSADLNGTTYGLYIVGDYAFLANTDNAAEFQVIKGGALYSGTFISSTFDAGSSVGFNYLTWTGTNPARTNIRFQIATNNDGSTWKFVGPSGFSTTFYGAPGAIPLQKVAGRYIRYKFILSSNINGTSPVVEDVAINYSP